MRRIDGVPRLSRRRVLVFAALLGGALLSGAARRGAAAARAVAGNGAIPQESDVGLPRDCGVALTPEPLPPQVPARTGMAQVPGAKLWYWDTGGEGEPIVLLHPKTGSGLVWSYQQPVFAEAGYRVIGYSRRGHRNSESGAAHDVPPASEDLQALVNFLKLDRFHLVSTAAGAFVGADYALSHPERLRTLVLACTMLGIGSGKIAELTRGLRAPELDKLPASFRELGPSYRAINPEGTQRWQALERESKSGPPIEQPFANALTLELLRKLGTRTLLISGGADLLAPPPVARLLAQHIPHSELIVLPECGHSAYWEQPTRFNDAVLEFVRGRQAA
jgi:pimeloyl-ACP methyl ester carboxylesterase